MQNIKYIFFDFGGTLDLDGVHWYDHWIRSYKAAGIEVPESDFKSAYLETEKNLNAMPPLTCDYLGLIRMKAEYQLGYLYHIDKSVSEIAELTENLSQATYEPIEKQAAKSLEILEALRKTYKLGVISNFYGNLDIVLRELLMRNSISNVIDSKIVQIRKPNPEIYEFAVQQCGLAPEQCVMVGDSYRQDIEPAKSIGMKTIMINSRQVDGINNEYDKADIIVNSISEIINILI